MTFDDAWWYFIIFYNPRWCLMTLNDTSWHFIEIVSQMDRQYGLYNFFATGSTKNKQTEQKIMENT